MIALDVLRALQRSPDAGDAFVNEIALAEGSDRILDREIGRLRQTLASTVSEADARRLVEQLAHCWGASLCLRHEPAIADAYIRSRLNGEWGSEFGSLPSELDLAGLAQRACPITK